MTKVNVDVGSDEFEDTLTYNSRFETKKSYFNKVATQEEGWKKRIANVKYMRNKEAHNALTTNLVDHCWMYRRIEHDD